MVSLYSSLETYRDQNLSKFPNFSQKDQCPECHGFLIVNSHETICFKCGLVVNDLKFDCKCKETSRAIEKQNKVRYNRKISDPYLKSLFKTRIKHYLDKQDRVKRSYYKRLLIIKSELHLTEALFQSSFDLFWRCRSKRLLIGLNHIEDVFAVCLYHVSNTCQYSLPLNDILKDCNSNPHIFYKKYQGFLREFKLTKKNIDYSLCISKWCNELGIPLKTQIEITDHYTSLSGGFLSGKKPSGVIAAIIYYHSKNSTQKKIAIVVGVSDVTLRTNYNLVQNLHTVHSQT